MRPFLPALLLAGVLAPAAAVAQAAAADPVAAPAPAPPPFKRVEFTGDLSFVSTTGNSEVSTSGATDKLIYRPTERWTLTQTAGIIYGRSNGDVVAENYRAAGKGDYAFGAATGAYGLFGFDRNVFAGIAARYELSGGLSAKPVNTDRDQVKFEAGVAHISQRALSDSVTNFFSGRAAGGYKHNFTPASYIELGLEVMPNLQDSEDLRVNGATNIVAPISSHIGLKAGYTIRWDGKPEPTFKETDTVLTSGVQISF